MTDNGQLQPETSVKFERVLTGSLERVWELLTDGQYLAQWFGGSGMAFSIEPRVGGAVSLLDGHIRGVVTQWKPPRLLTYTWNVFMPGETESQYPESYVTWELSPQGNDVLLTLTHRPMKEGFEKQTMMGWHTFLDLLISLSRGERLEARETVMERNRARYGVTEIKR